MNLSLVSFKVELGLFCCQIFLLPVFYFCAHYFIKAQLLFFQSVCLDVLCLVPVLINYNRDKSLMKIIVAALHQNIH